MILLRTALALAMIVVVSGIRYPVSGLAQVPAQDTALSRSQERLAEIRRERQQLQSDMERLRGRVHSITGELNNIERQVALSGRAVNELDLQVTRMGSRWDPLESTCRHASLSIL